MHYPLPNGQRGVTRQFEETEVGAQSLIDGVRPVTLGEKLTARTAHPMTPKRNPMQGRSLATTVYSTRSAVRKSTC
ncbi:hypothetical protein [Litorimonas sp.]|uniref:hypothetical protein n=1 Tax=Litorimonas sp. TaxID=1892381 RepID=UPI003A8A970D